jgi:hypothetical protein
MGLAALCLLTLAACDPRELADKAVARTAEAVIAPVLGDRAARCVVENGSPAELREIARDVGVEAGTSTMANILAIARRPATLACFAREGVAPEGVL